MGRRSLVTEVLKGRKNTFREIQRRKSSRVEPIIRGKGILMTILEGLWMGEEGEEDKGSRSQMMSRV